MSSVMTDAFELVKDLAELKDYGETIEDANVLYLERMIRERVGRLSRAYTELHEKIEKLETVDENGDAKKMKVGPHKPPNVNRPKPVA